jgi:uncharacterized protein YkwD
MSTTLRLAAATAALMALSIPAAASAAPANERAEANMVAAVNHARAHHGLPAMMRSGSLMESAGRFSHWLMANDTFGHVGSIRASNRFALLGEALAMHSGRRFRVGATVRRWLASPSHRAIVLSHTMRWVGTGVTRGRMRGMRATVWVLHTGRLAPSEPGLPNLQLP